MQAKNINVLAHFNAMNMISPGSGCEVHTASIDSQESLRRIAQADTLCATVAPDLDRVLGHFKLIEGASRLRSRLAIQPIKTDGLIP